MTLSTTLEACVRNELRYAVEGIESANQSEKILGQRIVAVITFRHCLQSVRQNQATEAHFTPLIDALQQTLTLGGLKANSRHTMVNALSSLCRRTKYLPRHVKVSASSAATICLGPHPYITHLPNKDVFHRVPHQGRFVQIERYRAKSDAQESNTEQLIHDIIIRFNYSNEGLLPFLGAHQDVERDFRTTYLISHHRQSSGIRDYTFNRRGVRSLSLLKALLKALDFLHSNGIAHGRLKPSEVVVDDAGRARLLGLGLGVLASADGGVSLAVADCVPLGEYMWMSPELLRAHRDGELLVPTAAGDIYSFALLAYEIFTGKNSFPEIGSHRSAIIGIQKLFKAVVDNDERPTKPAEGSTAYTHHGMTDDIWNMIQDCWAPEPAERPSARDILNRPFMIVPDS
ncbi:kinase-like protein [Coprinellus micaceus]|uniref:Kinase-like protein n=1 Tax=Coprinellus micaceus TaxID=71717 RepID=A0A4Y7SQ31_COPMI|nr:kinase-like protein [Coprinellus micaceus]